MRDQLFRSFKHGFWAKVARDLGRDLEAFKLQGRFFHWAMSYI